MSWLLYTLPPWIQHHGWWHHQCSAPCSVPYIYIYKLINDMLDRMLKDRKLCLLFQLFHDRDLSNHCKMNWILSPYCGKDEEIPSKCPRFSIYDKACGVMDATNLGHNGSPPPSLNIVIIFSHSCLHMYKISIITHWISFSSLFCIDILWQAWWLTSRIGLSHKSGYDNFSLNIRFGRIW